MQNDSILHRPIPLEDGKCPFSHRYFREEDSTVFLMLDENAHCMEQDSSNTFIQSSAWRRALGRVPPKHIQSGMMVLVPTGKPAVRIPFQIIDASLQIAEKYIPSWLLSIFTSGSFLSDAHDRGARVLVIGDLFFTDTQHHKVVPPTLLQNAIHWLTQELSKTTPIALQILKEFSSNETDAIEAWTSLGFHAMETEAEMTLSIEPSWKSMDDYLKALKGKYRQRYRSTRKKGRGLSSRFLNADEIVRRANELQPLLQAVVDRCDFSITTEHVEMYAALKRKKAKDYRFRLYELDGKAVAFSTSLIDKDTLVAHRVGMDYAFNRSHKLYQNILYDYAELGIENACRSINYGRTAMEIKSTTGAEPSPLSVLVRHPNWFMNRLLALVLPKNKEQDWVQRWPFRHERPASKPKPMPLVRKRKPARCIFSPLSFA